MYLMNPLYWWKRFCIFVIEERMLWIIRKHGKVLNEYASGNMQVEFEEGEKVEKYLHLERRQQVLAAVLDEMEANG